MRNSRGFMGGVKVVTVAGAIFLLANLGSAVRVQAAEDAFEPVEKYSKEIDQLKSNFAELGKKIDNSAKVMDGLTDIKKAQAEIDELKSALSGLLGAVADNGEVAMLGVRAEERVDQKLRSLQNDTRFKPEERNFLIDQWRKLQSETRAASGELGAARKEFSGLLQVLQSNEDFIDELVQIRQAKKAIDVLRNLTAEIRDASGKLKVLIGGIKAPST